MTIQLSLFPPSHPPGVGDLRRTPIRGRRRPSAPATYRICLLLLFLVTSFTISGTPAHGASGWSDTFTNSPPQRTVGDPLHGLAAEKGGVTWRATSGAIFGSGTVVDSGPERFHVGGLPFDPASELAGSRATLTGSFDLSGASWVAIGFTSSPELPLWAAGEVWLLLRPNGSFVVRAGGDQHTVTSGMSLDFHPQASNQLSLTYDLAANSVSASVNSHVVLQDGSLDALPYSPSVSHAGFQLQRTVGGAAGAMAVDHLDLDVTPPPSPALTVANGDVAVSGVTAGGDVALLGVVHGREPWLGVVSPRAELVTDGDGDGLATLSTGDGLAKSLWIAVDTSSGRFGVAAGGDSELKEALHDAAALSAPGSFVDERGSLLLLVVRPGGATWYGQIHDGGVGDLGSDSDGLLDADLGSLSPVGEVAAGASVPPALSSLQAGDVVVGIDPVHLEYYVFAIDP
ncbi:MAG: hypothetical protein AAGD06_19140 [Acidobacteriota bacterium]